MLNPTVLLGMILHQQMSHFSKKLRKINSKMSENAHFRVYFCLLYTSDAADEL